MPSEGDERAVDADHSQGTDRSGSAPEIDPAVSSCMYHSGFVCCQQPYIPFPGSNPGPVAFL